MKTREEVENLKADWESDPCYEIEDTEGFEEYREELKLFSQEKEKHWEEHRKFDTHVKSVRYGTVGNDKLTMKISWLENQIFELMEKIEKLEVKR